MKLKARAEAKVVSASKSRKDRVFICLLYGSGRTVKPDAGAGSCGKQGLELLFLAAYLSFMTPDMRITGKLQRGQKP